MTPENRKAAIDAVAKEMQMLVAADRWKGRALDAAPPEKWHRLRPETQQFWLDIAAALLDRIAPMMAPRVKPLVWVRGIVDYAKPLPGMKYVACSTTPQGSWVVWLDDTDWRVVEGSQEKAKAAAQADYESRILAALEGGE